ncbi:MAG: tRNA (uridine(34)/cytosine(34)/5-carboxymethylaminomethyluridine(34)-2'-O)-methyltransferase TrmL [Alkaliphilus sp.]|nr:tRNA (cytidine(34)-2'-O)-methyltransferase [Alkaliphilus sp. AH-315-G20]PHS32790.1 MAG: tRNA (uridine(34)/cytosine(34)/5-carboxymethylaminomethyluridine(34)-2'-O)-methyltransferase TrmL [Alkaliphilus sp.]
MSLNIVLYEPEIPQNTGNIVRTCVVTDSILHIIGPTGFSMDEKHIKRAGLDYWELLKMHYYKDYDEFKENNKDAIIYYCETRTNTIYSEVAYEEECFIMFGKETTGIPKSILDENAESCVRIPMLDIKKARSLNLSNTVAIVIYEVLRQWNFVNMK